MGIERPQAAVRGVGADGDEVDDGPSAAGFAFDIHVRRDVDEKFSAEGIRAIAHDIREGVIYESNGVRVTAF